LIPLASVLQTISFWVEQAIDHCETEAADPARG
jgi:hypothetical protein